MSPAPGDDSKLTSQGAPPDSGPRSPEGEAEADNTSTQAQEAGEQPGTPGPPEYEPENGGDGGGDGGDEPPSGPADGDSPDPEGDPDEEESLGEMGLMDHLNDLRTRFVRCFIAVFAGFAACYAFSERIFEKLMEPMVKVFQDRAKEGAQLPVDFFDRLKETMGEFLAGTDFPYPDKLDLFFQALEKSMANTLQIGHFQYTYPPEAFFTYIKVSLVAGLFLVSPYIFYQVWSFVAPGLYSKERRYLLPVAMLSGVFFVSGALFGYFVVFPFGFEFFMSFSNQEIHFIPKLSEYLSFCLKLLFAFGLVFELPLFIFFLARMGLVSSAGLRKKRKYAILVAFITSAILTPPDPFTQTLMAGPLVILYELGIWVAYFFGKKEERHREPEGEAEGGGEPGPDAPAPESEKPLTRAEKKRRKKAAKAEAKRREKEAREEAKRRKKAAKAEAKRRRKGGEAASGSAEDSQSGDAGDKG